MKLEFLHNINDGRRCRATVNQLVRLYNFNAHQAQMLRNAIQESLIDNHEELDLSTLDFIEPLNCTLVLRLNTEDAGIVTADKQEFFCDLKPETYRKMIDLMDPFCKEELNGYQWLYDA